jgi:hypothetical protein
MAARNFHMKRAPRVAIHAGLAVLTALCMYLDARVLVLVLLMTTALLYPILALPHARDPHDGRDLVDNAWPPPSAKSD